MRTVGITGSRNGLSFGQQGVLEAQLSALWVQGARTFHHGDCVGVDQEASYIARRMGYKLVAHPPIKSILRAYVDSEVSWEPNDYLTRDRDIVDCSDFVIGCPDGPRRKGSGTWYTIGYAEDRGVPVLIVHPEGTVS